MDFLTKKRVKNEGHVPQYYVENSHEGIIPKELFLQAQEELQECFAVPFRWDIREEILSGANPDEQRLFLISSENAGSDGSS